MTTRAGSDAPAVGPSAPVGESRRAVVWRAYRHRVRLGVVAGAQVAGRTLSKAWHDRILGMSAETAFWQLLSFPSMLIALVGAIGVTARWLGPDAVDRIRDWALSAVSGVLTPRVVDEVVRPVVNEVLERNRTDVIGIGTVVALWTGSSAMATFVNTITIAYGQRNLRGAVRSRLVALRLYLFTVLGGMIVLPAVVFGPGALDSAFDGTARQVARIVMHALYWPVLGLVVFGGITAFYHWATPIRLRWRRAFPGALLALTLFLVISYGLQVYIAQIATNLRVYSTLAAPVLALMYFYGIALSVLLGAEFNAALEERWPRGRRPPAVSWLRETAARLRRLWSAGHHDEPDEQKPAGQRNSDS